MDGRQQRGLVEEGGLHSPFQIHTFPDFMTGDHLQCQTKPKNLLIHKNLAPALSENQAEGWQ